MKIIFTSWTEFTYSMVLDSNATTFSSFEIQLPSVEHTPNDQILDLIDIEEKYTFELPLHTLNLGVEKELDFAFSEDFIKILEVTWRAFVESKLELAEAYFQTISKEQRLALLINELGL
jgi:hypothetical protein